MEAPYSACKFGSVGVVMKTDVATWVDWGWRLSPAL